MNSFEEWLDEQCRDVDQIIMEYAQISDTNYNLLLACDSDTHRDPKNNEDCYFKVYHASRISSTKYCCRIFFFRPEYVKEHKDRNGKKHKPLDSDQKELLCQFLDDRSYTFKSHDRVAQWVSRITTNFQFLCYAHNYRAGFTDAEIWSPDNNLDNPYRPKGLIPMDMPIPDYTLL